MTDEEPAAPVRRRSWPRILVAAYLALSGFSSIFYAGFLPLLPFSDEPVPVVLQAFGVVQLIAAVGIYQGRSWGRWLAVVVVALSLVQGGLLALLIWDRAGSFVPVVTFVGGAFIDVVLIWWLGWRWAVEGRRA